MATSIDALPDEGESIYEVVMARDWMRAKFYHNARGIFNMSLTELLIEDPEKYKEFFDSWMRHMYSQMESDDFFYGIPGTLRMAYGKWVERELRLTMMNRLSIVKEHPAWKNISLSDKLRLATQLLYVTSLRSAEVRTYAWDNWEGRPEACPRDEPFYFIDNFGARHKFNLQELQPVWSFGPEKASQ